MTFEVLTARRWAVSMSVGCSLLVVYTWRPELVRFFGRTPRSSRPVHVCLCLSVAFFTGYWPCMTWVEGWSLFLLGTQRAWSGVTGLRGYANTLDLEWQCKNYQILTSDLVSHHYKYNLRDMPWRLECQTPASTPCVGHWNSSRACLLDGWMPQSPLSDFSVRKVIFDSRCTILQGVPLNSEPTC